MPARSTTITIGALLFCLNALTVSAFHVEYGTNCTSVGTACSYISNDSSTGGSATTTVSGFCAPDLHCASQGAKCTDDDSCFNYCGTDGTCGGQGAGCNTQDKFVPGQSGIACDSTGDFQCTATGGSVGQCLPSKQVKLSTPTSSIAVVPSSAIPSAATPSSNGGSPTDDGGQTDEADPLAPSQANARRSKRRMSEEAAYHAHQVRSSDLRKAFARHQSVAKKAL